MNYETIKITLHDFGDTDILVREISHEGYLWWRKEIIKEVIYRGNCTVWHRLSDGRRASTWLERHLSEAEWLAKQKSK